VKAELARPETLGGLLKVKWNEQQSDSADGEDCIYTVRQFIAMMLESL
jgi:hypothetical protein